MFHLGLSLAEEIRLTASSRYEVGKEFQVRRMNYRLAALLFLAVLGTVSYCEIRVRAQGQAGGGTLSGDALGGAALIFRKPDNPPLHTGRGQSSGTAGGGTISGTKKARAAAAAASAAHERVIAKGNAARSAPTPRYSEAEQQYKLAAAEDPKDARAYAGLGNIYLDQGRFNEAVTAYRQGLKISPDYLPVFQPLAFSLVRLGRYPEAIETFKQALQYDPNNAEIYKTWVLPTSTEDNILRR